MIYNEETRTYTLELKDAIELFRKIPFMVEEFNEVQGLNAENRDPSSMISPLLAEETMNTPAPSALIQVALNTLPYYAYSSANYSETRDAAYLDVPRSMREDFWNTLFRDAFATELNSVINTMHNKLKYVYLSEEHILNRGLFKKLITLDDSTWGNVPLTLQEEEGDVETLDTVISEKLTSIYKLLDYSPPQSSLIEDWMSSLYLSGQIDYQMKLREENLFKIQDLKSELLRRKFAGSISLYRILASSINRSGTFAPVLPLFSVTEQAIFADNRAIRALDMPGITTRTEGFPIDPLKIYEGIIPARTVYPLYYTSAGYDADDFENNATQYLRNNKPVFAWDNLRGIVDASLVKNTYPRFDQPVAGSDTSFIKLDEDPVLRLDETISFFDMSTVTGSFFDIQADEVLYHRNSLQEELGQDYPYVTYTISGNSGLSMMDFPWLDFMAVALDRKTRVQEQVDIGVQVSRLSIDPGSEVTENFVIVTFSENFERSLSLQDSHYDSTIHRYAYLWNLGIHYDVDTFICRTTASLITYMLLRVDETTIPADDVPILSAHASYDTFIHYTSGMIPFAYKNMTQDDILNMRLALRENELGDWEIIDDVYEEEYNKAVFLFTPHENVAISKRYLRRTPESLLDIGGETPYWFAAPNEDKALKHIIYGISRYNEELQTTEWFWSEPVRVYPKELFDNLNGKLFHPDWKGLAAYINPYLNMTEKSSSPLRGKEANFRALKPTTLDSDAESLSEIVPLEGPSLSAALMNINLDRGYALYTSQTGDGVSLRGTYFHREVPDVDPFDPAFVWDAYILNETLQIWGDNRPLWDDEYAKDPADNWDDGAVRSQWAYDEHGLTALLFRPGYAYDAGIQHATYFDLRPEKDDSNTAGWNAWVWNDVPNTGMSACIDLLVHPTPDGIATENYYLLSRHTESLTATDMQAEFDFYIDRTTAPVHPSLVMNVYVEGTVDGIVFTCELPDVTFITNNQQSQIACSYYYEQGVIEGELEVLHITQTIVADREWHSVYRVIVKNTVSGIYDIYETASDFDIAGLTPTEGPTIAFTPYTTVGVDDTTPYFFGHLIKDRGGSNNTLEGINVFNRDYGYNPTLGNLYDLRLFNRGMHTLEIVASCAGSRKELYSYSPSIYKLAYQHFTDPGILKRALPTLPEGEGKAIGRIRVFSRSVWNSILTDMYPVSAEETDPSHELYNPDYEDPKEDRDIYVETETGYTLKSGVIEQLLVPHYETEYDISFNPGQVIYYKNRPLLADEGIFSLVQTSLYPVSYKNERFYSTIKLAKDDAASTNTEYSFKAYFDEGLNENLPAGADRGSLSSAPAGESLIYKADLDLNFELNHSIDLGAPFARGRMVNTSLRDGTMSISHVGGNTSRKTSDNQVIVPFYVPDQTGPIQSTAGWAPRIHKFALEKATLAPRLVRLLNATTYYNELQIPIPYEDETGAYVYTSRWDAIRVMKEGEYFFTCKYPFQIIPLRNSDAAKTSRYPTFYATTRFKLVVTGEPIHYEETIEGVPGRWLHDSLNEILSSNLYTSADNRSFPHRLINIDLYSLEDFAIDAGQWYWKKVASNYDAAEGVKSIDPDSLGRSFSLETSVSALFSATYATPFFDRNGEFDILTIGIADGYEQLTATTLQDPLITLAMGTSYKMLFDYTGQVTELKFFPGYHEPNISDMVSDEEFEDYNHCVDLLSATENRTGLQQASYYSLYDWSIGNTDYDLSASNTGFYVDETNEFAAVNTVYAANNLSLGNPYSQATQDNLLLDKYAGRREDINSLGYFPYRVENVDIPRIVAPRAYGPAPLTRLPELSRHSGNLLIIQAPDPIDEYSIIAYHHQARIATVRLALNTLRNNPMGLFEALSILTPQILDNDLYNSTEALQDGTHEFVSYEVRYQELLTFSGIQTERYLPYGHNLLVSNEYSIRNYFEARTGAYAYDADLAKDIWSMQVGTASEFTFTYSEPVSTTGRVRARLRSSDDIYVALRFSGINNSFTLTTNSQLLEASAGWSYLTFTVADGRQASRMSLVYTNGAGNLIDQEVSIDTWEFRQAVYKTYEMGLAEAYTLGSRVAGSDAIPVPGFKTISFKRIDTQGYFPIQTRNTPGYISREDSSRVASGFIEDFKIPVNTVGSEHPLFKPWKRRLKFTQSDPESTSLHIFTYEKQESNNRVEKVSTTPAPPGGIFEIYRDSVQFTPPTFIEFAGEKGLIYRPDRFAEEYNFALDVSITNPFTITNERFTMVSNCINYDKFIRGISSPVAITNIQLINNSEDNPVILYELEYLPIIYDELRHHFSLNLLMRE